MYLQGLVEDVYLRGPVEDACLQGLVEKVCWLYTCDDQRSSASLRDRWSSVLYGSQAGGLWEEFMVLFCPFVFILYSDEYTRSQGLF